MEVVYASNVDLRSDLYSDIEYLSAYGVIDSTILGVKPIDRAEFVRLVVEASKNEAKFNFLPKHLKFTLEKLKEEFEDEIVKRERSYIKPIRKLNLKYSHLKGSISVFPGINASQEPFNYNNEGIALKENNFFIELESDARFAPLSFYINPILITSPEAQIFKVHKGYVKLYIGRFSVQVGKDSLWWGQARHGSLILTNNVEPFVLLKINNETPFNLPILGLFRIDLFLIRLEQDRDYPKPYFGGARLSFKPTPYLEFGLARTAITGEKVCRHLDLVI